MSMEAAIESLIKCLEKDMYGPSSLMQGSALRVESLSMLFGHPIYKMKEMPKTEEEIRLAKMFYEDYGT